MMILSPQKMLVALSGLVLVTTFGCATSMQVPATSQVAVTKAAVDNAAGAGAAEYAPMEMNAAREKLAQANKAMADENYTQANELASSAQADANLAQSKANSAKAQAAAKALQDDIRVLREELNRSSK